MESKGINEISETLVSNYKKAVKAAEKGNKKYAAVLLKSILQQEPAFLKARETLRNLQKNFTPSNFTQKIFGSLKILSKLALAGIKIWSKNYRGALNVIEEALAININNLLALRLLGHVGKKLEANFIMLEAYELAQKFYPNKIKVLKDLAEAYRISNQPQKEVKVRQRIVNLNPGDLQEKIKLRETGALVSMEEDNWGDQDSSYRSKLKDEDESKVLEQKERFVRNYEDVKDLIQDLEAKLKNDENNLSLLKRLGDLYQKAGRHEDALHYLKQIREVSSSVDIEIEKKIEKSQIALLDSEIKELKSQIQDNPNNEEELNNKIKEKEKEIFALKKDHALKRVKSFPNDLHLRYSLAVILWEEGNIDSAIEQFQYSQRNPNKKLSSTLYLGHCFLKKQLYDLASEQFNEIMEEDTASDKQRLEALYYLGITYESQGKTDEAAKCFKKVYAKNAAYKDISERIQKFY